MKKNIALALALIVAAGAAVAVAVAQTSPTPSPVKDLAALLEIAILVLQGIVVALVTNVLVFGTLAARAIWWASEINTTVKANTSEIAELMGKP